MLSRRSFSLAIMLLPAAGMSLAVAPPVNVVLLQYRSLEPSAERLEKVVASPLERSLSALPRVTAINSTTSHGTVDIEVHFQGGATEQDLANVMKEIAPIEFDENIPITFIALHLRPPRLY